MWLTVTITTLPLTNSLVGIYMKCHEIWDYSTLWIKGYGYSLWRQIVRYLAGEFMSSCQTILALYFFVLTNCEVAVWMQVRFVVWRKGNKIINSCCHFGFTETYSKGATEEQVHPECQEDILPHRAHRQIQEVEGRWQWVQFRFQWWWHVSFCLHLDEFHCWLANCWC